MSDWIWIAMCILDRKISARMQNRVGPPILQPLYDVKKFLAKEQVTPNKAQDFYVMVFLLFTIVTGAMFFAAFEPIILLMAICYYMHTGSFSVSGIVESGSMSVIPLLGVFVAFMFGLTMKLRKSPFDLSLSHHAHQDIVRGMATEFSGKTYASLEVAHWYESVMLLGMVALFFADGTWVGAVVGILVALLAWVLEIWIDNGFARMTWQTALKSGWVVGLVLGVGNVAVLLLI